MVRMNQQKRSRVRPRNQGHIYHIKVFPESRSFISILELDLKRSSREAEWGQWWWYSVRHKLCNPSNLGRKSEIKQPRLGGLSTNNNAPNRFRCFFLTGFVFSTRMRPSWRLWITPSCSLDIIHPYKSRPIFAPVVPWASLAFRY